MTEEMPPALPDGFVCKPGTVPGWLNGDGLPTSCVGDDPMPEPQVPLFPPIALDPPVKYEVGLYLYRKVDADLPASWSNSGPQSFVSQKQGAIWFDVFPGALPGGVCGDGWAVQQDAVKYEGVFSWPESITYPDNVLSQQGVLVAAKHQELSSLVDVPECGVDPTPTPTPEIGTPITVQPELAPTGSTDAFEPFAWAVAIIVLGIALMGLGRKKS